MNEVQLLNLLGTEGAAYVRCRGKSARRLVDLAEENGIHLTMQYFKGVPEEDCLVVTGLDAVRKINGIHTETLRGDGRKMRPVDRLKKAFNQVRSEWPSRSTLSVQLD